MDAKKSNKITEIVRLQQILKKWKKLANASKTNNTNNTTNNNTNNTTNNNTNNTSNRGIKFLKKTLSFSDNSVSSVSETEYVPKGYLAVCVGKELKRYVIPTDYLAHQAFGILLHEAEEEFGFQQEGVLKIPCEVAIFDKILTMVEKKREKVFLHEFSFHAGVVVDSDLVSNLSGCCSPDCTDQLIQSVHPQLCR